MNLGQLCDRGEKQRDSIGGLLDEGIEREGNRRPNIKYSNLSETSIKEECCNHQQPEEV